MFFGNGDVHLGFGQLLVIDFFAVEHLKITIHALDDAGDAGAGFALHDAAYHVAVFFFHEGGIDVGMIEHEQLSGAGHEGMQRRGRSVKDQIAAQIGIAAFGTEGDAAPHILSFGQDILGIADGDLALLCQADARIAAFQ